MRLIRTFVALALLIAAHGTGAIVAEPAAAAPFPWTHDLAVDLVTLAPEAGNTKRAPAPHVVDWNDDGRDDLVVGLFSTSPADYGGIAIYLRQADGSLAAPRSAFASGDAASAVGSS